MRLAKRDKVESEVISSAELLRAVASIKISFKVLRKLAFGLKPAVKRSSNSSALVSEARDNGTHEMCRATKYAKRDRSSFRVSFGRKSVAAEKSSAKLSLIT